MRRWRMMFPHANVGVTISPGPTGREIAANIPVEIQQQRSVQRTTCEQVILDVLLDLEQALRQQRCELCVGENAAGRLYEARGVRRLCRVFSHSKSTGSPSNAMLAAT